MIKCTDFIGEFRNKLIVKKKIQLLVKIYEDKLNQQMT